ncbi:MAG: hypothetical protein EBR82_52660 [Caulobacteraceae bacterium]|nr:hypothetical protein [Caulobacteraceae bacterium]
MSEKQIGIELKKQIRKLEEAKETAISTMAETISLAADAGQIILSAREENLNIDEILLISGINGEQARRLERVAKSRPLLSNPNPSQLKQLALWSGILPDPIEVNNPKAEQAWHSYIIKARQWLARKSPAQWSQEQKAQFIEEARPIVEAYREAGGEV